MYQGLRQTTGTPRARLGFRVPAWWGPREGDATVVYGCTDVRTYIHTCVHTYVRGGWGSGLIALGGGAVGCGASYVCVYVHVYVCVYLFVVK